MDYVSNFDKPDEGKEASANQREKGFPNNIFTHMRPFTGLLYNTMQCKQYCCN